MVSAFGTAIERLLALRCPSTIAGFVPSFVVDPVNAHPFRSLPHIGEEVLEGVAPAVADSDSTPPVTGIVGGIRVGATANNVGPGRVFDGASQPMTATSRRHNLPPQAPATADLARREIAAEDGLCRSAVAHTIPEDGAVLIAAAFRNDGHSFKRLADEVKLIGHPKGSLSGVAPRAVFSSAEAFFVP